MKKVVIGVSGVLTDNKERVMRGRLQPHFEGYEIVLIPFMNGSLIVPEDSDYVVNGIDELGQMRIEIGGHF